MRSCVSCKNQLKTDMKKCNNQNICKTNECNKLTVFDWLSDIDILNNTDHLVEVRFKNDRKGFYKKSINLHLSIGSTVIVESSIGYDLGIVSLIGNLVFIQLKKKKIKDNEIKKIYRIANESDINIWKKFREKENSTLLKARQISKELNLLMKISDVEYQGDGTKATFYYTADNRIDFRELIKEFALTFHCKIDMRQIGYRQESSKIGGIGSCGRELCCSSWLTDFRSVNTIAARYQQLSINPQKLSGQCGKLKCCLNFELDTYLDAIQHFPSQNTIILTKKGNAVCLKIDVFRKKMWFSYNENSISWFEFDVEEVKKFIEINKKGNLLPSLKELKQSSNIDIKNTDVIDLNNLNRFEGNNKKNIKYRSNNLSISLNKKKNYFHNLILKSKKIKKKIIKKQNIFREN